MTNAATTIAQAYNGLPLFVTTEPTPLVQPEAPSPTGWTLVELVSTPSGNTLEGQATVTYCDGWTEGSPRGWGEAYNWSQHQAGSASYTTREAWCDFGFWALACPEHGETITVAPAVFWPQAVDYFGQPTQGWEGERKHTPAKAVCPHCQKAHEAALAAYEAAEAQYSADYDAYRVSRFASRLGTFDLQDPRSIETLAYHLRGVSMADQRQVWSACADALNQIAWNRR